MKIFLKLKHWQIFVLWLFSSILMNYLKYNKFWFIPAIVFFVFYFGWIYSIGKIINSKNIVISNKLNIWALIYVLTIIPSMFIIHKGIIQSLELKYLAPLLICLLIGLFAFLKVVLIVIKSIQKIENIDKMSLNEYFKFFFHISVPYIGVWILQPKLNKYLIETKTINSF